MTQEEIFAKAIELPTGEQSQFLDQMYADRPRDRAKMEAMLAAHRQSDSLLDTDAFSSETVVEERPTIPRQIGDFEILRELGRGGMGVVYEAKQKSLKRQVALKILSSGLGLSSKAILRFRREAEAAGKLHHTNIVPIYTTGEDRGIHYYAMELIDGPSMDAVIKDLKRQDQANASNAKAHELPAWVRETALFDRESPMAPQTQPSSATEQFQSSSEKLRSSTTMSRNSSYFDTVAAMIAEVADALDHAHEHGVIHRDVKPSNLLLAPDGRLSINDFGLARMLEQPGMTITGEFVGSPLYMSPEQITAGRAPLDHRTDIYSLGATLYELLTLQPPFPGETRDQVIGQILHKEPKPPRQINRKVPVDLDTICMKAIERDPDRRYQSAGQLAKDLRAYVNRHAISARRPTVWVRMCRWLYRNPAAAVSFFALVLVIALVSIILLQQKATRLARIDDVKDRFMLAIVSGSNSDASACINDAKELRAEQGWISFMEGALELVEGNYQEAVVQLEIADRELEQDITAYSLLTLSYLWSGDEDLYYSRYVKLRDMQPKDFLEHLAKGWAQVRWFPDDALIDLEQARSLKQDSQVALLLHAKALRLKAMAELSSERAVEFANVAIEELNALKHTMPGNTRVLSELLHANLIVYERLRESGQIQSEQFETVQEYARMLNERIEFPDAQWALADYWAFLGKEEKLIELEQNLKAKGVKVDNYFAVILMSIYAGRGDFEKATEWFRQTNDAFDRVGTFFLRYAQLMQTNTEQARSRLESELCDEITRKAKSSFGAYLIFDWTVLRMLGSDKAYDVAVKYENATKRLHNGTGGEGYVATAKYMQGLSSPEKLETQCRFRHALAEARFAIAFDKLASGDREGARDYFQKVVDTHYRFLYVYYWSRAILKRMEMEGDGLFSWLPNSEAHGEAINHLANPRDK